jgi:hypothetical protein
MSTATEAPERSFLIIKYGSSHHHLEGRFISLLNDSPRIKSANLVSPSGFLSCCQRCIREKVKSTMIIVQSTSMKRMLCQGELTSVVNCRIVRQGDGDRFKCDLFAYRSSAMILPHVESMRKQDVMNHNFLQVDSSAILQSASKSGHFTQPWRTFVRYGRLQDGAYSRMALTTDQATDLQSPSADLANRASVFDVESLDEALKGLSCLDELRLT